MKLYIQSRSRPSYFFDSLCIEFDRVGSVYLPSHDGSGPSKPIICAFGPVSEQQKLQVGTFSSISVRT